MICPICNNITDGNVCVSCGYDRSCDGELFPTFASFPKQSESKLSRIRKRYEATAERCSVLERRVDALEVCVKELQDRINGTIPPATERKLVKKIPNLQPMPAAESEQLPKEYVAGDLIRFGKYIQNDFYGEKPDDIEWIIYKADADKLWLISRNIIEWKSMSSPENSDWKSTKLRGWLNGSFLDTAFSDSEKERMLSMNDAFHVQTSDDTSADADKNSINNDKVFLLSENAFRLYRKVISSHKCEPTLYVKATDSFIVNGDWWLSNIGEYESLTATTVTKSGELRSVWKGYYRGVRPIIFIKR